MRLLLDTHVLIWMAAEEEQVSRAAYDLIVDPSNMVLVSAVSAYEIELKRPRDRVIGGLPPVTEVVARLRYDWLAMTPAHAAKGASLPLIHRDPWDRILVAQAQAEGLTLVTADAQIARYDVLTLW